MPEHQSALIIKAKWALKLLNGEKTWEIRGSSTTKRGTIAIAISGTGKLYGEMTLADAKLVGQRLTDGRLVRLRRRGRCRLDRKQFEHHQIGSEEMKLVNYRHMFFDPDLRKSDVF